MLALLLTAAAAVICMAIIVILLVVMMALFVFAPAFSMTALIGIMVWIDHGFWLGLLAALAVMTVMGLLISYRKTHLALTWFISVFMCSMAFMMAGLTFVPALAPRGWMTIPVLIVALIPTYIGIAAYEDDYKADKNNIIVNLIAALLHGYTVVYIMFVFCGGICDAEVSSVLLWITFIAASVAAFLLCQKGTSRHMHIPVLDRVARELSGNNDKALTENSETDMDDLRYK